MTGSIPTTFTRLQAGTKWDQALSNMGDAVLSQRGTVAYTDTSAKALFRVPAFAQAVTFVVAVTTAFDASTLNMLSIGVSGANLVSGTYFVSGASVGVAQIADLTTSSRLNNWSSVGSGDTIVTATHSSTGTGATQGVATVTMLYCMKS